MLLYELFNIVEGRDAPLFHGTPLDAFFNIMKDDELRGWVVADSLGKTPAIRTTRDMAVAKNFAMKDGFYDGAVIELNQAKISNNYKIVPYADKQVAHQRNQGESEAEEAILTTSLSPLSSYITSFYISDADIDDMIEEGEIEYWDEHAIERMGNKLKTHPLRKNL